MANISILGSLTRGLGVTKAAGQGIALNVPSDRGWFPIIREPGAGAWQRGEQLTVETGLQNPTVFRCQSLIASDVAKMRLCLVEEDRDYIWTESFSPSFSPVLKKPNNYQNRIQFIETWVNSKLSRGNTVVLKERDNRGVVVRMHILDWLRVRPLVAPDGDVFYSLSTDHLAGLPEAVIVPQSEIIHDRWNCFFHPLVGLSPLFAAGMAALQGQEIQRNATHFFRNASQPGGVLTAPGTINKETADRIKEDWTSNYTGENAGRTAILGDGLHYEALGISPKDALLVEQLGWTAQTICSVYGVPAYMVGVGAMPLNNNVEALAQQYYSQCLQIHIESIELCLDEGLGLDTVKTGGTVYGTQFDLDGLLRMDTATQVKTLAEGVLGGLFMPDEGRKKLNLGPVPGGDAVYLQQQNYSLAALAKRDAKADPFASAAPKPAVGSAKPEAIAPPAKSFSAGVLRIFDVRKAA